MLTGIVKNCRVLLAKIINLLFIDMLKINNKGKLIIGLLAFVLITPLLVFYTLENSNIFDIRSSARSATLTDELKKADLDSNNVVSLQDFSIWRGYYNDFKNKGTYNAKADLIVDQKIGLSDLAEWIRLFKKYKEWVIEPLDATNPTIQVGYVGTGKDGDINVTQNLGNMNINTNKLIALEGRATSCPDAPQYSVESFASDGKSVTVTTAIETACLKPGDEVMLINLQGTAASFNNVGNYESLIVSSVSARTIKFTTAKRKHYGANASDDTGIGVTLTSQRVMVQRVPNYKNVTIASGGVLTGSGFDGKKGGVLFFRASGTVNIGGTITMTGKGYHGGAGSSGLKVYSAPGHTIYADSGQSGYGGTLTRWNEELPGTWLNGNITSPSMLDGKSGTYSGGGGAATWGTGGGAAGIPTNVHIVGNPGAGNSSSTVSGGGGGGGSAMGATFGGYRWWQSGRGGGGGGGGYGSGGYGGSNGNSVQTTDGRFKNVYCTLGGNGSASGSGAGGNARYVAGSYTQDDGYVNQGYYIDGYGGAGGGGSADYGTAGLTQIYMGSGGGGGGAGFLGQDQETLTGGAGGAGGGIILISAKSITVPGSLSSNGGNGGNGQAKAIGGGANFDWATSGGGGAGSGGSIRLEGATISVGSSRVTALGGAGGKDNAFCGGGNGGNGRIAVYSAEFSGSTSPTSQSSN